MKGQKRFLLSILLFAMVISLCAQSAPEWLWAKGAVGNEWNFSNSIAVDNAGNSYVTGSFQGIVVFGAITLTSTIDPSSYNEYSDDIFIGKLDNAGNWLWVKRAGGTSSGDVGTGIAVDSDGNCYATGKYQYTADFGTFTLNGSGNNTRSFVAKLDTNGNWLWVAQSTGTGASLSNGITVDGAGNSYITGYLNGTAEFGATTLADYCIFAAKLNSSGAWIWASGATGTGLNLNFGIDVDNSGNCYITGSIQGASQFGTTVFAASGAPEAYIAKLDNNGSWLWAKKVEGDNTSCGNSIVTDNAGNSYVTGYFVDNAQFGTTTLTSVQDPLFDYEDVFVTKLDTDGNWLWAKQSVDNIFTRGKGIAIDNSGNSYIACEGYSNGHYDMAAKLDNTGNWEWIKGIGTEGTAKGNGIALGPEGNCYVTGSSSYNIMFDDVSLPNSTIFIAKLSTNSVGIDDEITPFESQLSRLYDAYPNPARTGETIHIKADVAAQTTATVNLYNLRGQLLESHSLGSGMGGVSINTYGLSSGIYFYQLKTSKQSAVKKLVLVK